MFICVCLCILASSRSPRYDLGRQTPSFLRWFCHTGPLSSRCCFLPQSLIALSPGCAARWLRLRKSHVHPSREEPPTSSPLAAAPTAYPSTPFEVASASHARPRAVATGRLCSHHMTSLAAAVACPNSSVDKLHVDNDLLTGAVFIPAPPHLCLSHVPCLPREHAIGRSPPCFALSPCASA
jgi:hypothetical protein